jgi:uncharacterized protein (TIGR04255 family)
MTTPLRYTKAPIIEALIDIQLAPGGASLKELGDLGEDLKDEYPSRVELVNVNTQLTIQNGTEISSQAQRNVIGYMWMSSDQRDAFVAKPNGFSFRRLAPYQDWGIFVQGAQKNWERFRQRNQTSGLTRVAVKYTNRFDLPMPIRDFRDYLRTCPEISTSLPQAVQQMFMQLVIPVEDIGAKAIITETIVPPVIPNTCAIIFDIDIFRDHGVPQQGQELWDYFEKLRNWKNLIFDSCTTDRMKELIR